MEYNTHDNYSRPYKVIIRPGNNVQVYLCVHGETGGTGGTGETDVTSENNQSYEL